MGRVTSAWQRIGLLSEIFTANHCCKKDKVPLNHLITYVVQVISINTRYRYLPIGVKCTTNGQLPITRPSTV